MAEHQVALKRQGVLPGDRYLRELAEPGRHPVYDGVVGQKPLDVCARPLHLGDRRGCERDLRAAMGDAHHILELEGFPVDDHVGHDPAHVRRVHSYLDLILAPAKEEGYYCFAGACRAAIGQSASGRFATPHYPGATGGAFGREAAT